MMMHDLNQLLQLVQLSEKLSVRTSPCTRRRSYFVTSSSKSSFVHPSFSASLRCPLSTGQSPKDLRRKIHSGLHSSSSRVVLSKSLESVVFTLLPSDPCCPHCGGSHIGSTAFMLSSLGCVQGTGSGMIYDSNVILLCPNYMH